MHQNNRNLFSLWAVLVAAGVITSIGSVFLLLTDQLGSGPQLVLDALPSRIPISTLPFETVDTHSAIVLSVSATTNAQTDTPLVASGSYDSTVHLWTGEREDVRSLQHNGRVDDLTFTADGQQLVTGSGAGDITLWSVDDGSLEATAKTNAGRVLSLAVDGSRDGSSQTIAASTSLGALQIWSLADVGGLKFLWTLVDQGPRVNAIAFHPTDDAVLVSGDQDGLIHIWNVERRQIVRTLDNGAGWVVSLAISSDGRYIASGGYDQKIRIWDLASGNLQRVLAGHDLAVSGIAFSPDDRLLASSSYDESIKTWDWADGKELCTLRGHAGFVYSVAFADGGSTLVSGGYDGTVRTWDLMVPVNRSCLPR
ncbi:MAG: WD40 repeat domain-containing protein [Phormidesmis sp.]